MDLGISGRNYVVLGGTRGIGFAAARALAADGASVAVVGRDAARAADAGAGARRTAARDARSGSPPTSSSPARPSACSARRSTQLGPLRGVAVTTGLGMRGQRDLLTATDEDWEHTFSDVLLATVRACRAAVPILVDGGGGAIVTTAAYSVRAPKPHQAPYASLKAGVATLTKTIAKSYRSARCACQLRVPRSDRDRDPRRDARRVRARSWVARGRSARTRHGRGVGHARGARSGRETGRGRRRDRVLAVGARELCHRRARQRRRRHRLLPGGRRTPWTPISHQSTPTTTTTSRSTRSPATSTRSSSGAGVQVVQRRASTRSC